MLENENFIHAGELIKSLIDKLLPSGKHEHFRLSAGWEEIAGTEVAMHVFPRDIEGGILILETDHPGWSQKIMMTQGYLLRKIQKKYPQLEVKKIKVFVGDGCGNST